MSSIVDRMTRELHESMARREEVYAIVLTPYDFLQFVEYCQSHQMMRHCISLDHYSFMGKRLLIGTTFMLVFEPSECGRLLYHAKKDDGEIKVVK